MSARARERASMKPQVLVVGAGPVGLTMAAELARYGVSVRIVDKNATRTDKSKALVVWSRTLELLDRADCSGAFVAAGQKVTAANIIAGDKLIGHVELSGIASPYPYALMLPQSETERLLEAHLGSLGIRVEREVEMISLEQAGDGVTTVLRRPDAAQETLQTDWLVGCDGAHSGVRHALGLSFLGDTLRSDWILADIHLAGAPFPSSEIATYWHEDGVLAVFPISPGRYRVIADLGRSEGDHPTDPTLEEVQAVIARRGPAGLVASAPIWLSAFRINERKVADYRFGRVFVAGDAAHVHSPAGGQGMNTGMQDAFNLAWKLALVCRGTCRADGLLASYSAERSAVGQQVLTAAGRLTALAVLKNHAAQSLRNFVGSLLFGLAPVRDAMANVMTEISIGYSGSPLNGPGGLDGPAPGQRVAPIVGQSPVGAGGDPRFALFAAPGGGAARLLGDYRALLEPALRPPLAPSGVWLVRPDGYVATVARDDRPEAIADWLGGIATAGA
jgi:2-polyprenyl-6-methoxyphenol hydroxylase-like FAD-dependent oxidoreductase